MEVSITPVGERIVEQAQRVLEESATIREIAKEGKDPRNGPLRLGVIHTIGPYLLPGLVPAMLKAVPQMPLLLQEGLTAKLLEALKLGEIDVAVVAEPLPIPGIMSWPVYDEPFAVVVPTITRGRSATRWPPPNCRNRPCCCWVPVTASATRC